MSVAVLEVLFLIFLALIALWFVAPGRLPARAAPFVATEICRGLTAPAIQSWIARLRSKGSPALFEALLAEHSKIPEGTLDGPLTDPGHTALLYVMLAAAPPGVPAVRQLRETLTSLDLRNPAFPVDHYDRLGEWDSEPNVWLTDVEGLRGLERLKHLFLTGCSALQSLNGLRGLKSLADLNLAGCTSLESLGGLEDLPSLEALNLYGCERLRTVQALRGLKRLRILNLEACIAQESIEGLEGLASLEELDLAGCERLRTVQALRGLNRLRALNLMGCTALESLEGLEGLESLETLRLDGCRSLHDVSALAGLSKLRVVTASRVAFAVVDTLRAQKTIERLDS